MSRTQQRRPYFDWPHDPNEYPPIREATARMQAIGQEMAVLVTAEGFTSVWAGLDVVPASLRSEFFRLAKFIRNESLRHRIAGPWYSLAEREARLADSRSRSPLHAGGHALPPQPTPAAPRSRRQPGRPFPSRDAQEAITKALRKAGRPLTRKELARESGYKEGSIAHYVRALKEAGVLTHGSEGYSLRDDVNQIDVG